MTASGGPLTMAASWLNASQSSRATTWRGERRRKILEVGVGSRASSSLYSSSKSFSPGRRPVNTMSMSLRPQAREPDQVAGEVDDLHRLAHVEHEDLAAAARCAAACSTSCAASGMVMKIARRCRGG